MIQHPIAPVYDDHSNILILGSFPSVKSREQGFFYGHPQNRFWRVLAAVYGKEVPQTVEEKEAFLLRNGVAVWDVIASCDITGSSDASVKNAVPVDIRQVTALADIQRVYCNGSLAAKLYQCYLQPQVGLPAIALPSTSPANAAWGMERLVEAWQVIRDGAIG